jgi:exodeoxyribonuclease VII small subunit
MTDENTSPTPIDETELSFESAMSELEALVTKIETGNLSLEDSLKEFENGIKLSRVCQSALKDAEHRVKILSDVDNNNEQDFAVIPE